MTAQEILAWMQPAFDASKSAAETAKANDRELAKCVLLCSIAVVAIRTLYKAAEAGNVQCRSGVEIIEKLMKQHHDKTNQAPQIHPQG